MNDTRYASIELKSHTAWIKSVTKAISKSNYGIFNRLRSILDDSKATQCFVKFIETFPILANLRCGKWYIPPTYYMSEPYTIAATGSNLPQNESGRKVKIQTGHCYFKSTDGHINVWDFNESRLNLNVLEASLAPHTKIDCQYEIQRFVEMISMAMYDTPSQSLPVSSSFRRIWSDQELVGHIQELLLRLNLSLELTGCCTVDSTRKGKSFPDSFSRTIPIWAAVFNTACWTPQWQPINDGTPSPLLQSPPALFHSPPWMSPSEQDQIVSTKIPTHVEKLRRNVGPTLLKKNEVLFVRHPHPSSCDCDGPTPVYIDALRDGRFGYLYPVWLHRETYQTSIAIMNDNAALFVQDIYQMVLSSLSSSDFNESPAEDFTTHFLCHLLTTFNMGMYLPIHSVDEYHYSFAFIEHIWNISKSSYTTMVGLHHNSPHYHANLALVVIAAVVSLLSRVVITPLLLYSCSRVDRINKSYNTRSNMFSSPSYSAQNGSDVPPQTHSHQNGSCVQPNLGDADDKQNCILYCPFTFTTQSLGSTTMALARDMSITGREDGNNLQNITHLVQTHRLQNASSERGQSPVFHDRISFYTSLFQSFQGDDQDAHFIPGAGDDQESWATRDLYVKKTIIGKPLSLGSNRYYTYVKSLLDSLTSCNQCTSDAQLAQITQQMPEATKDDTCEIKQSYNVSDWFIFGSSDSEDDCSSDSERGDHDGEHGVSNGSDAEHTGIAPHIHKDHEEEPDILLNSKPEPRLRGLYTKVVVDFTPEHMYHLHSNLPQLVPLTKLWEFWSGLETDDEVWAFVYYMWHHPNCFSHDVNMLIKTLNSQHGGETQQQATSHPDPNGASMGSNLILEPCETLSRTSEVVLKPPRTIQFPSIHGYGQSNNPVTRGNPLFTLEFHYIDTQDIDALFDSFTTRKTPQHKPAEHTTSFAGQTHLLVCESTKHHQYMLTHHETHTPLAGSQPNEPHLNLSRFITGLTQQEASHQAHGDHADDTISVSTDISSWKVAPMPSGCPSLSDDVVTLNTLQLFTARQHQQKVVPFQIGISAFFNVMSTILTLVHSNAVQMPSSQPPLVYKIYLSHGSIELSTVIFIAMCLHFNITLVQHDPASSLQTSPYDGPHLEFISHLDNDLTQSDTTHPKRELYTKQQIRSFTTQIIDLTNAKSGIFLPRHLLQQLNVVFCQNMKGIQ